MTDLWLPGFERIANAKAGGGTYLDGFPWRFVGHMTEVIPSGLTGARALAARHENPPQLWCWPEKDWKAQTIPLNRSGFALLHPAGTPHTNKMRAIQVEVIGYSKDSPTKPAEFWRWIGEEILLPVIRAGIRINLKLTAPTTGADGAGVHGKVRMSDAAWRAFDGLCVHANVPHNIHWDMGAARLDLIAAAATPPTPPPTPPEEDDMATAYIWFADTRNPAADYNRYTDVAEKPLVPGVHVYAVTGGQGVFQGAEGLALAEFFAGLTKTPLTKVGSDAEPIGCIGKDGKASGWFMGVHLVDGPLAGIKK